MSYKDLQPPELKTLPEFMRAPSPQIRFHSAFPPLTTTKRVRSVMERAGFDVYRPDRPRSSGNRSTPNLNTHRNFTAPGTLATQRHHDSDPQIQHKMMMKDGDRSTTSLPLDARPDHLKQRTTSAGASFPDTHRDPLANFQLGDASVHTSRTGSLGQTSKLPSAADRASAHSDSSSRRARGLSGMSQASEKSGNSLNFGPKPMVPQIVTSPASSPIHSTPPQPPTDVLATPPLRPSSLQPSDTPLSKSTMNTTEEEFEDANSSIDAFDAKFEAENDDSVEQLLSMRKELSPTQKVDLQIPQLAPRPTDSMASSIYNAQDIQRLNDMQSPEFKVYNTQEEDRKNDMSTIQEDTEYDDGVSQVTNKLSRLDTSSQNSVKSPERAPSVVKFSPGEGPCRKCGLAIATGQKSIWSKDQQLSGQWHRKCFSCITCSKPFSKGESCYVHEDFPYCELHFHEKNGSLCTFCGQGIEGECLSNEHGELFHVHCLSCSECGVTIRTDYFVFQDNILCENDGAKLLAESGGLDERTARRHTRLLYL
ncbi:hypothetical protein KL949_001053 [Ogataea haglerorum]|uniref:Paxillin-like protein 1 n=1 Tax=Ogataea haglerorum TaxID=1937702 RepID=A0ABQ7RKE6_9ASCO|nr:hypothetical protein KL951_001372 [Ogataea haglerorum]KAG7708273.1 hypothetical protein KL914_001999 [Ogataea haglerorum]KAG7710700.1 hypothetical protein KL950_001613 [Ogataea haglerorum]KAG7721321.1 hypothetical protein KL913_001057 [Ogataea haglerorum]KAG7722075.1 hypothetical protein KL949_001053 [Ogataea haglerorum]